MISSFTSTPWCDATELGRIVVIRHCRFELIEVIMIPIFSLSVIRKRWIEKSCDELGTLAFVCTTGGRGNSLLGWNTGIACSMGCGGVATVREEEGTTFGDGFDCRDPAIIWVAWLEPGIGTMLAL